MYLRFRRGLLAQLFFIAIFAQIAPASDDQAQLRIIFEKAKTAHNIRKSGLPAYILTGTVSIWTKDAALGRGSYRLVATPDGMWREELKFASLSRVRIGNGKQFTEVQVPDIPMPALNEFDLLLNVTGNVKLQPTDNLKAAKPPKSLGNVAQCVKRRGEDSPEDIFCFDTQTGDLLSKTETSPGIYGISRADVEEYSDFQVWSGKTYPRKLRSLVGKQPWIDVQLEEFKPAPQLPTDFFTPSADAKIWGDCDELMPWKLKDRVQPDYPGNARRGGEHGTVIIYAVIETDGSLHDLRVVHTATDALDESAMDAVSKWRFQSVGCSASPGRTQTYIDVMFSLGH